VPGSKLCAVVLPPASASFLGDTKTVEEAVVAHVPPYAPASPMICTESLLDNTVPFTVNVQVGA
jgi:hypothetical protein